MPQKKKEIKKSAQKIHNIVIDAQGKAPGLTDHQVQTLNGTYHLIEELCVSAHALSLFTDFLAELPPKERDELTRMCTKIGSILEGKKSATAFIAMEIMYVNTYARMFDTGISAMFNQVRMEREGVMYAIQAKQMEEDKKKSGKNPPQKQPENTPRSPEIA